MIRAVPRRYSGVTFRSTLEADWAFNLDLLGIQWSYEPQALSMEGVNYLPDFWLPQISTWLEVKGPGVPGAEKVHNLRRSVYSDDSWWTPDTYVVLGLPPERGRMCFHVSSSHCPDEWAEYGALAECAHCRGRWFLDYTASFQCRCCLIGDGDHHLASTDFSGDPWWAQNQWQPVA